MKVLFIPWFNSSAKNINKYINLYKKHGVNIHVFNYNYLDALRGSGHYNMYNKFKKDRQDYDMIHCVSGGSLILYNLIKGGGNTNKIIFDSGPMFATLDCTVNYFAEHYNCNSIQRKAIPLIINNFWYLDGLIYPKEALYQKKMMDEYETIVLNNSRDRIILTDYSDKLVQHNKIEKLNIPTISFENSKHAQHFKIHPEKYNQTIADIMSN